MASKWHEKKEKARLEALAREEAGMPEFSSLVKDQVSAAAMGEGEEKFFDKKPSKEAKKALAKAKRDAKKQRPDGGADKDEKEERADSAHRALEEAQAGVEFDFLLAAAEALALEGTVCTFSTSRKAVDARSRDISIQNFTLQHKGVVMLDETQVLLNHGNRYGLIGRNGCGKSTLMRALGARAVPIPAGIDSFHLKDEIQPSDSLTALDAVMAVDEERARLEKQADNLNAAIAALSQQPDDNHNHNPDPTDAADEHAVTKEEQHDQIMDMLSYIYDRLDALDADTAETRARSILRGLGFTHAMQGKLTKDFSGGWRMRVSLARALFIQPTLLLLDEPTNHLDMEAVIWLEEYLSKWDKILLLISHSQDFLNNVCSHMIHFTTTATTTTGTNHRHNKLEYYDGNYDQFVKTKAEKEENQMKQYRWEQQQIKSMKEYIARFGHGTSKNAKQAQSKEKVLEKMLRAGLTEKPNVEKPMNFNFPDPGHLPPPVLAFHNVSFAYPGCEPLYDNVSFGVDLDSRVALVGPNGAGKTTLVKLMNGELLPTIGDIRPHGHLKMGRFTQHFVDVLDLEMTPLEFFEREYPKDGREDQRKYLGRFGVSGRMQVQKMEELSDGQKSRVVFAKLGRDVPHILLLDEPTNHLDMESIDSLAEAVNGYKGGLVLVSHDMRLISQVAKEIWICDAKRITKYRGDIQNFKMDMRRQMGITTGSTSTTRLPSLRGDASVATKKKNMETSPSENNNKKKNEMSTTTTTTTTTTKAKDTTKKDSFLDNNVLKANPTRAVVVSPPTIPPPSNNNEGTTMFDSEKHWDEDEWDDTLEENGSTTASSLDTNSTRQTLPTTVAQSSSPPVRYIPPHLRKRL